MNIDMKASTEVTALTLLEQDSKNFSFERPKYQPAVEDTSNEWIFTNLTSIADGFAQGPQHFESNNGTSAVWMSEEGAIGRNVLVIFSHGIEAQWKHSVLDPRVVKLDTTAKAWEIEYRTDNLVKRTALEPKALSSKVFSMYSKNLQAKAFWENKLASNFDEVVSVGKIKTFFKRLDAALKDDDRALVNFYFSNLKDIRMSYELKLGAFRFAYKARERIPHWSRALQTLRAELQKLGKDADKLLHGLEK